MLNTILAEIAPTLLEYAPTLAASLISPIAGVAMTLLGKAFNIDPQKPQELIAKITDNVPAATEILKALETQHGGFLKGLVNLKMPSSIEINVKINWNNEQL